MSKIDKTCSKTRKNRRGNIKSPLFTKEEYHSGDGMLTTVWGPSMWHVLHAMSFNYPIHPTRDDMIHYREFVLNLEYVLPCKYCRINLEKNFKQLPLTMEKMKNRDTFSKYIYDLHELVNKMLNKNSHLTYDDVRERYEHFRARCTQDLILSTAAIEHTRKSSPLSPKKKSLKRKEKGCTEPLYGKKAKCILKIVPQEEVCDTFQIDQKCVKKRLM